MKCYPTFNDFPETVTRGTICKDLFSGNVYIFNDGKYILIQEKEKENTLVYNLAKLNQFSKFEDNWDGYGAKSFNKDYIAYTIQIIKSISEEIQPEIFPTNNSKVQFEWGSVNQPFYLEITPNLNDEYEIYYTLHHKNYKQNERFKITIQKENLNSLLKLILDRKTWI